MPPAKLGQLGSSSARKGAGSRPEPSGQPQHTPTVLWSAIVISRSCLPQERSGRRKADLSPPPSAYFFTVPTLDARTHGPRTAAAGELDTGSPVSHTSTGRSEAGPVRQRQAGWNRPVVIWLPSTERLRFLEVLLYFWAGTLFVRPTFSFSFFFLSNWRFDQGLRCVVFIMCVFLKLF